MSVKNRRTVFFIYRPIQILILKVIVASCLLSVAAVLFSTVVFFISIKNQYFLENTYEFNSLIELIQDYKIFYFTHVFVGLLLAVGLIIYSWLKLSHKIAGPLYRMRFNLKEFVVDGKEFVPIKLRKDDEMHDLADLINRAVIKGAPEKTV